MASFKRTKACPCVFVSFILGTELEMNSYNLHQNFKMLDAIKVSYYHPNNVKLSNSRRYFGQSDLILNLDKVLSCGNGNLLTQSIMYDH